ncbi:DUF2797 domain-containing protein [Gilvimarinus sp. SDUM040013]|uniref:DUF2797 domain-containing protein n=1 Tax=Gilvimarinus gilvus TaxID=3058038 RepID=A0ABU4S1X4_9GAMM|nr:DUF2797 domain-containing protein [Gilvimarinus sp. SDUM040013]MDO3385560.1 DUF2797 domain-containing protein [Gilvimarinus sp. SDUM040013]MDX6851189.1 DUF2797 domain-containing protein [Gilvimarinus sp. SDUM040013]
MAVIPVKTLPGDVTGALRKMSVELSASGDAVEYSLHCGDAVFSANALIGQTLTLAYTGEIRCLHCDRKTRKSFSQGYCYPCFQSLAQCDSCIVSPEKCHYHLGTCREPSWAEQFCMNDHVVYLANSSSPKVGITRATQIPTRWIDQGAVQALPIFTVPNRRMAGLVEVACKPHISDRTQWQRMLKGSPDPVDLRQIAIELIDKLEPELEQLRSEHGADSIVSLLSAEAESVDICYPVPTPPLKVKSVNLEKTPVFTGELTGIKGQYLIFGDQVLNVRKFGGYHVTIFVS